MYNLDKLNGLVIEKCYTRRNFAAKMGLSEKSIYLKLKGKVEFKPSEIDKACEILNIKAEDIPSYFFCKISSEKLNNKNIG